MRWWLVLIVALSAHVALAASVGGTVSTVSGNVVEVNGAHAVAMYVTPDTEVWKGKVFHDASPVEVGDSITAQYHIDASGRAIADAIWLNITNVYAVITKVTDSGFEVFTNPNADPASAYRKEIRKVAIDANTAFEESAREDLKPGRNVQIVGLRIGGLRTGNGEIQATRVIVYEGNHPVRMRAGAVVRAPNGSVR